LSTDLALDTARRAIAPLYRIPETRALEALTDTARLTRPQRTAVVALA